jgi:hypothetical protein
MAAPAKRPSRPTSLPASRSNRGRSATIAAIASSDSISDGHRDADVAVAGRSGTSAALRYRHARPLASPLGKHSHYVAQTCRAAAPPVPGNTKPRVSHPLQRAVVTNCYSADPIFRAPAADRATLTTATWVVNSMRPLLSPHATAARVQRMRSAHATKVLRARRNTRTVERNSAAAGRTARGNYAR